MIYCATREVDGITIRIEGKKPDVFGSERGLFSGCTAAMTEEQFTEKTDPRPCAKCGGIIVITYTSKAKLIERCLCFNCNFWQEVVNKTSPLRFRVKGRAYALAKSGDTRGSGTLGHAGHLFHIAFDDGRRIKCNNVWHNGIVPARYADQLPDNAEFCDGPGDETDWETH